MPQNPATQDRLEDVLDRLDGSEVAIVGLTCRFPGARDERQFWDNLRSGVESISRLEEDDLDLTILDPGIDDHPDYVRAASVLEDADLFDASFFEYSPKEAEVMDPQQRLFLEGSWQALERAGYDPERYPGLIGVFAGCSTDTYVFNLFSNRTAVGGGFDAFQVGLGNDLAFLANRVSYKLGLRGPSLALHTACSTSLVAIHLARQSLLLDECQMALAGAVTVRVPQKAGYLYQQGGVQSPDGHTRPFDRNAAGTLFGSGLGILVLKRLEDALEDGDRVRAVIRGSAINNDGSRKASFTAPSVYGQTEVLLEALTEAGVSAESLGFLEAHGTGTNLGDPIEVRALTRAFRRFTDRVGYCALGSVKSNVGHLDSTAGMPGLVKTVLALEHEELPPTLHFEQPNPKLDLETSPFYVPTETIAWPRGDNPRRAGLSSFGVGGTNAHLILEEAPLLPPSPPAAEWQLLILSARSEEALDRATDNLARHLDEHPEANLADVAFTLQVGRKAFKHRRCLVCRDLDDAGRQLRTPEAAQVRSAAPAVGDRPVVFLFPGGGAQHVDMGRELYDTEPAFRRVVDRAAKLLAEPLGLDLRDVLYPSAERREEAQQRIQEVRIALPALLAIEIAAAELWRERGLEPAALLGHSMGDYAAACLAGIFSLEDALHLVVARGRLLTRLGTGGMVGIELPEAEVTPLIGGELSLAVVNGPTHCVVSGPAEAVDRLTAELAQRGVEHRRLHLDAAGHSALVEPVLEEFEAIVTGFDLHEPQIPCISNRTGTWLRPEEAVDPHYWTRHLRETVRFHQGLATVLEDPTRVLLEVGPGRTLTSLVRRQVEVERADGVLSTMRHPADERSDRAFLLGTVGDLWLSGVSVDWERQWAEGPAGKRRRVELPTYPFERSRFWIEPGTATAGPATGATGKSRDLADWFYVPSFARADLPGAADLGADGEPGLWLVLGRDADDGLTDGFAGYLEAAGERVMVAVLGEAFAARDDGRFVVASTRADFERLVAELAATGERPRGVVHLAAVTSVDGEVPPSTPERFRAIQDRGYHPAVFLASALVGEPSFADGPPIPLVVVADRLLDLTGVEAAEPEKATLPGALKVISQEQELVSPRVVDVPVSDDPAARHRLFGQIAVEALAPAGEPVVARRGDRRWVQRFEPLRIEEDMTPARPLRDEGTYLITGGLGGVGRLLGSYLARETRARLVLTGRSEFPARETWEAELAARTDDDPVAEALRELLSWEELGARVLTFTADVNDEERMAEVLDRAEERFGPLRGVLHTAGVTSGSSLYRSFTDLGVEEAETQFGPKGYGVYALERALGDRRPDFCLLFSSNAAVLGGLGYLTYSAVNGFMDAFAIDRSQRTGIAWLSADWDAWPAETKKYEDLQTSMDQYSMTPDESREAFRRIATIAPVGQVSVPTGDFEHRFATWVSRSRGARSESSTTVHPRPAVSSTFVEPRDETESRLAELWRDVLGLEQVGVQDSFFDLGGHSLLATRLVARVNDTFSLELPLADFFKSPTIEGMARNVALLSPETDDQELLELLDGLSDEEVEGRLKEHGGSLV